MAIFNSYVKLPEGTYYMVDLDGMPYQYWIHGGMMTWSLDQILTWSWNAANVG